MKAILKNYFSGLFNENRNFNKIDSVRRDSALSVGDKKPKNDIKEAASEFESLFIYYILKTMRKSVMKSGFFGNSKGEDVYNSMLDEKVAQSLAKAGGIGLRDVLLSGLENRGVNGEAEGKKGI